MGSSIDPWEHLKWYLQGNFEYHLFWHIASCFSNISRYRLRYLYVLKPYASSLATSKSWGIQTKVLDKSVKTASSALLLSSFASVNYLVNDVVLLSSLLTLNRFHTLWKMMFHLTDQEVIYIPFIRFWRGV